MQSQPEFDEPIQKIADYVINYTCKSEEALKTSRYCLLDALGNSTHFFFEVLCSQRSYIIGMLTDFLY